MTIKDIAAKCGVSVATVSRVINNYPHVKPAVREKVLKVIEEEHFVPHDGAVSLVKPQTDSIGVVVRGIQNIFFNSMIPHFEKTISECGYNCYFSHIHSNEDEIREAVSLVKSKRLKGVVLLGGRDDYTIEQLSGLDVPYVLCTYTNSFGSLDKSTYSSVTIDDEEVACKAVTYLIEKGHKDIAILLPSTSDQSISQLRFRGYQRALKEHGITKEIVMETGDFSMAGAREALLKGLEDGKQFSAIFAFSDSFAMAAIKGLSEKGKKVPEDCSVIGVDGMDMSNYFVPTLTTLVQPGKEMAEQAVRILYNIIENREKNAQITIDTQIRIGESVQEI